LATYSICPIPLCEGGRNASQYSYCLNYDKRCTTVCYSWYIKGSKPKILVDTGQTASMSKGWDRDLTSPEDGLAKLGLKPEDIEIVILTHLHYDHIALGHLYPTAKFIVQKRELDYARNPHPIDARLYRRNVFENLNLEVIDGQKEIIPGVSVFLTPGHSPGGQSVEINTTAGKAIITGFCCHLFTFDQTEEVKERGWEVTAPLLHHDVREAYDSVLKVKRSADIIIAQHDPEFIGRSTIP